MGIFDKIGDAVSDGFHAVAGAAEDAADALAGTAEDVGGAAASFASDTFSVVKGGAEWTLTAAEDVAGTVGHAAEDVAKETGGVFKKAAKWAKDAAGDVIKYTWRGVEEIADGIGDGLVLFGTGIGQGISGFFSNIAKGKVADAFDSLVDGLDKAVIQSTFRYIGGIFDGIQAAGDGVLGMLGPLEKPLKEVFDRGVDVLRTCWQTAGQSIRTIFQTVTEAPIDIVRGINDAAFDIADGRFLDAAKDFGMGFVNAAARLAGGVVDYGAVVVHGAASVAQLATGTQPPSRRLTDQEKDILRKVYGDSVDLDSIRIVEGGPLNADITGRARTIGNTIYMPKDWAGKPLVDMSGNLTKEGKTLVHETGHVWQSQNGGTGYIHGALWSQNVGDGYDYKKAIAEGKSFREMNPEQQAEFIEQILGPALSNPGDFDTNLRKACQDALGRPTTAMPGETAKQFSARQRQWDIDNADALNQLEAYARDVREEVKNGNWPH